MKRIGIITWHYYPNYGSRLQIYALQNVLIKLGFDAEIINYKNKAMVHGNLVRILSSILIRIPKSLVSRLCPSLLFSFNRFDRNHLKLSNTFYKSCNINYNSYDAVICGSDQILAPNVYNPTYMLDFVSDNKLKISYAASIGLNKLPEDLVPEYTKFISRINYISVREEKAKELLLTHCGIDSTVVLDPTLLVNINEWKSIEQPINLKKKFVFCYFLNKNHKYKTIVQNYAHDNNLSIYGVSENPNDTDWMTMFNKRIVGPCEFLGLINEASVIFTDSYHGTIFSLLYHKKFVTFERFSVDDSICQNSRIEQLAKYFDIHDNIVKACDTIKININEIDYRKFETKLSGLREFSLNFINKALS